MSSWLDDILDSISLSKSQRSETYTIDKEQIPKYLRLFQIGLINNEFSISPDKNRINPEMWLTCKKLSSNGFVIGGSLLLKLYGLLDREIDDIDVFCEFKNESDLPITINKIVNQQSYEDDDLRMKVESNFGKLDIFNRDYKKYSVYDGVKLGTLINCLKAKHRYLREKDLVDFETIFNRTIWSNS